jgi:uncharacterized membrane protein YfcA
VASATLLLLAVVTALAAFIQGTVGMGFALVVAPVMGLVAPGLLPVSLLVLMLPLNAYVTWRERHHVDLGGAGWITGGRTLGALAGVWIVVAITRDHLNLLIGLSTVAAAIGTFLAPVFRTHRLAFLAAGIVTGVTETATGIGGPPLALVYQHHRAPVLRSTIALCFALGEVISLALFAGMGQVRGELVRPALVLVPAVLLGASLSRHWHRRVDGKRLRTIVTVFSLVSGLIISFRAWH